MKEAFSPIEGTDGKSAENRRETIRDLKLKKNADGLVAAVVQDAESLRVLMVGWMDEEALARTLDSGFVTFWSRSRYEYWQKGETSGNRLNLVRVELDCDRDALLVFANPVGPTCHTGAESCFDVGGELAPAKAPSTQG